MKRVAGLFSEALCLLRALGKSRGWRVRRMTRCVRYVGGVGRMRSLRSFYVHLGRCVRGCEERVCVRLSDHPSREWRAVGVVRAKRHNHYAIGVRLDEGLVSLVPVLQWLGAGDRREVLHV